MHTRVALQLKNFWKSSESVGNEYMKILESFNTGPKNFPVKNLYVVVKL